MATKAPVNDLLFIKQVTVYSNAIIKKAALTAFSRHLWYLSEIMVGLSFFDPKVDPDHKVLMLKAMQEREGSEVPLNRLDANGKYDERQLCNFVTKNTKLFFSILGLPISFLEISPKIWAENVDFKDAEQIVWSLKVVNDTAERGVKLITDYNNILTKNEDQKQFLLQVVREHRKLFPDSKRSTTIAGLNKLI